ncbi:hypothetical protein AL527_14435 [Pseudomonas fulva]|uniref:hypothetical protein n=1 Tax=Pseudomonas fulva TaxID=47880 RepID=UPI000CE96AC6|nr:hypothetical protein [Pseudomonas fulva]AVF56263.1 hypothetical protein AL527_14435 [Pseudomonas fulva]
MVINKAVLQFSIPDDVELVTTRAQAHIKKVMDERGASSLIKRVVTNVVSMIDDEASPEQMAQLIRAEFYALQENI